MTVAQFRNKSVSNTRLLWLIHGHKVVESEFHNFTSVELVDIYRVEDDEDVKQSVKDVLTSRGHDRLL